MPNGYTDFKAAFESVGLDPNSLECKYSTLAATIVCLIKEREIAKDSLMLIHLYEYLSKIDRNAADQELFFAIKNYIYYSPVPHLKVERE